MTRSALVGALASVLLPAHAHHPVLVHFPIASFIAGVGFDIAARLRGRRVLAEVAYFNFLVAAWSILPTLATGALAWRIQLEGQALGGVLRLHLALACLSSVILWVVWRTHARSRARRETPRPLPLILELVGVAVLAGAAHLGGTLSGVNLPM
jgi:uncharacterized membrane protein